MDDDHAHPTCRCLWLVNDSSRGLSYVEKFHSQSGLSPFWLPLPVVPLYLFLQKSEFRIQFLIPLAAVGGTDSPRSN
ncbi:hypothetical protein QQP08_012796 [Theobroma cacao]|nr:hypothetical protein QQP08_012796 [Theobroma cacao]